MKVTSCGTSGFHTGEPADNRARTELLANGYPRRPRRGSAVPLHYDADLPVAADHGHVRDLERKRLGDRVRLLRSFDPAVRPTDLDLSDPTTERRPTSPRPETDRGRDPRLIEWTVAALDL